MRRSLTIAFVIACLAGTDASPGRAHGRYEDGKRPPPAGGPLYAPPAPGTYALPPIDRVVERELLGTDGRPAPLLRLARDKAAIVSFIYRSCSDATGCPLALSVMQRLDASLSAHATLARRVRLVTVSFDPVHDTPARMKELRRLMDPKSDWRFLTAADAASLDPVLEDFGQHTVPLRNENNEATGQIQHVMKVFLVDGQGDVRNIYSTGLFDERLLMNDLITVLGAEEDAPETAARAR